MGKTGMGIRGTLAIATIAATTGGMTTLCGKNQPQRPCVSGATASHAGGGDFSLEQEV